jgi:hypothetical protein
VEAPALDAPAGAVDELPGAGTDVSGAEGCRAQLTAIRIVITA